MNKPDAQARTDRIRAFRAELDALDAEGVPTLAPEDRARVAAHHDALMAGLARQFDVDTSDRQKQVSWGMRIASVFGAAALAAALFLFFHRYWGLLATPAQIVVAMLAPVLPLAGAVYAARRETTLYYAGLLGFIAIGGLLLNLAALGMIFNLAPAASPWLAVGLFAVAIAYHFDLRPLLLTGLLSLEVWFGGGIQQYRGFEWLSVLEESDWLVVAGLLVALFPLVVRQSPHFAAVYRGVGLITILLALFMLSITGRSAWFDLARSDLRVLYRLVGLVATSAAIWTGIRLRLTGLVNTGSVFFLIFLMLLLGDWLWDVVPNYLFFLLIGLLMVGLVGVFRRLRSAAGAGL